MGERDREPYDGCWANGWVKWRMGNGHTPRAQPFPLALSLQPCLGESTGRFARQTTRRPLTKRTKNSTMAMTSNT